MGTLTITATGFANLPATAPTGWPADVTYPAGESPNGTKTYTVNDAEWLKLLQWAADSQFSGTVAAPATPTAPQILLAWLQIWINGTKNAVQQYFTTAPSVPPQITIA